MSKFIAEVSYRERGEKQHLALSVYERDGVEEGIERREDGWTLFRVFGTETEAINEFLCGGWKVSKANIFGVLMSRDEARQKWEVA